MSAVMHSETILATRPSRRADSAAILLLSVAGMLVTFTYVLAGVTLGAVGLVLVFLTFVLITNNNMTFALAIYFSSMCFQSIFISFFIEEFDNRDNLVIVQGLQFMMLAIMAAFAIYRYYTKPHETEKFRRPMKFVLLSIFFTAAYFAYGAAANGTTDAIVYLRNTSTAAFCILVGYYAAVRSGPEMTLRLFKMLCFFALVAAYLELMFPYEYYEITGAYQYLAIKLSGRYELSSLSDIIAFSQRALFNIPFFKSLDLTTFRISGPNLHPISFAYLLTAMMVFAVIRSNYFLIILAIPPLVAIQAKGPLLVFAICALGYSLRSTIGPRTALNFVVASCVAYALVSFRFGLQTGDYHVIGFMGGVNGFLRNPFGYGLGAGGNLARELLDWPRFQRQGAADFGLESSVGVLLYQMGIAALFVVLGLWGFIKAVNTLLPEMDNPRYAMILYALMVMLVNGIFQEEAYGPYAFGLMAILGGSIFFAVPQSANSEDIVGTEKPLGF